MYVCPQRSEVGVIAPGARVLSLSTHDLGTKLHSSEGAVSVLNHWAIEPQDVALIQLRSNSNGKKRLPPRETNERLLGISHSWALGMKEGL